LIQKASGVLHARVRQVGPEHFGIVCVDPAKIRSKWMLADFYGKVLVEPTTVEHTEGHLAQAVTRLQQATKEHGLKDLVVAVERTGNYHEFCKRAFRKAGYETRVVHPFATKQYRLPANPGDKTDDNDLAAMHRAAANGFGLLEPEVDQNARHFRMLVRHRRDLVRKNSRLRCQIQEHLYLAMPGYAKCFDDLWDSNVALPIARATGSPSAVQHAGVEGLSHVLIQDGVRFQVRSLHKILVWSQNAPQPDPDWQLRRRIICDLEDDRSSKALKIQALEREICSSLVKTPYVLWLAIPGINVVSAAELGAEMGPIGHYANANHITGRAGVFPGRYQSDEVDRKHGLVRCANTRLRAALMQVSDNLVNNNHYFGALAAVWKNEEVDQRLIRVRIAKRFSRVGYAMAAGQELISHSCCQPRHYILEKLLAFHREHDTPMDHTLVDLNKAIDQLPENAYRHEAVPLCEKLDQINAGRSRRPQRIGEILPAILARLLNEPIQSVTGDQVSN
jgi:transposase